MPPPTVPNSIFPLLSANIPLTDIAIVLPEAPMSGLGTYISILCSGSRKRSATVLTPSRVNSIEGLPSIKENSPLKSSTKTMPSLSVKEL